MTHDDPGRDIKGLWQSQSEEEGRMSLDEIRRRSRRLEKIVGRRNFREYAAALLILIIVGVIGPRETNVVVAIGGTLIALGALYVVYYLHKRGSARSIPADLAVRDCIDFHRSELVRQRDLLRSVWFWYLLPFVPGTAMILIGRAVERPDRRVLALVMSVVFVLGAVVVGKLNERGARRLQRIIDGLDQARS